ncbi:MAG: tetratricopeptide repeat protein [Gemmatimonadota bacterium]
MSRWRFWKQGGREEEPPDYYEEGLALLRAEAYHEALTSFRLALRERPDDPATLEQMAVVYTHIGVTEEAVKLYRAALRIRPSPAGHYGLAFLLLRRGATDEAAEHLRAFLEAAPDSPEADKHVGHARETLARLEREPESDGPGPGDE